MSSRRPPPRPCTSCLPLRTLSPRWPSAKPSAALLTLIKLIITLIKLIITLIKLIVTLIKTSPPRRPSAACRHPTSKSGCYRLTLTRRHPTSKSGSYRRSRAEGSRIARGHSTRTAATSRPRSKPSLAPIPTWSRPRRRSRGRSEQLPQQPSGRRRRTTWSRRFHGLTRL